MSVFLFPESQLVSNGAWLQTQEWRPRAQAMSSRQHTSQEEEAGSAWYNKGSTDLGVQRTRIPIPALPPTSFVTVGKVLWTSVSKSEVGVIRVRSSGFLG